MRPDDLPLVRYIVAEFIRRRRLTGQPIPADVLGLEQRLAGDVTSPRGRQSDSGAAESEPELIGTTEAARILQCSRRHATRLATDLDGIHVAGRLVFDRDAVTAYAQAKGTHDAAA